MVYIRYLDRVVQPGGFGFGTVRFFQFGDFMKGRSLEKKKKAESKALWATQETPADRAD